MKLSEIKKHLNSVSIVNFVLENGEAVPEHFHVTEVGIISKHFIDCGGTVRDEKVANFQLWDANDFDHRLKPQKLINIIGLSEKILGIEDLEIEVEYQTETIGKYNLGFDGKNFILQAKKTNCLASDKCSSQNTEVAEKQLENVCCSTNSSCC